MKFASSPRLKLPCTGDYTHGEVAILVCRRMQLTPLFARRSLKTRGPKISKPKTTPEIEFLVSKPDFHSAAVNTDFAPIRRAVSPASASAPARSLPTKLYFFKLKKTPTAQCKEQTRVFHWDRGSAPSQTPSHSHPSLPRRRKPPKHPKGLLKWEERRHMLGKPLERR